MSDEEARWRSTGVSVRKFDQFAEPPALILVTWDEVAFKLNALEAQADLAAGLRVSVQALHDGWDGMVERVEEAENLAAGLRAALTRIWDSGGEHMTWIEYETKYGKSDLSHSDIAKAALDALNPQPHHEETPIPIITRCPSCHRVHVDEGEWATKPHRTHRCSVCHHEWRPANVATVGVADLRATPRRRGGVMPDTRPTCESTFKDEDEIHCIYVADHVNSEYLQEHVGHCPTCGSDVRWPVEPPKEPTHD